MIEQASKNNLTLQIEKTAAKLAKRTELSSANRDPNYDEGRTENLKLELAELQKQKIDAKLFHARKELKATFKKCRAMELQKQIKRIREAEKAKESETTDAAADGKEKKQKKLTKEDTPRLESERELLKNLDLDALVERSLRNKILRHKELGENEIVKSTSTLAEPAKTEENQTVLDLGARILRHKTAQDQFSKIIGFIQHLLNPTTVPLPSSATTASTGGNAKKRKNDDREQQKQPKKKNTDDKNYIASSMFVDSLGGKAQDDEDEDDSSDDENQEEKEGEKEQDKPKQQPPKKKKTKSGLQWDDPDFDKYYHGEKKPNRMGQRYRRKMYEEMYGKEANHIKEARTAKKHMGKKVGSLPKGKAPNGKPKQDQQPKKNMEEFHPSWQAKLQQQEMMAKALSGTGKPMNNKIVFD